MSTSFLLETFQRVRELAIGMPVSADQTAHCEACIAKALDLLVEEVDPRIRLIPNYRARLRKPVVNAFAVINDLVDGMPGAVSCSRKTFVSDPRTNAFFANPEQITEVFSSSREVRSLFDTSPMADECWGLLCMRKEESQHFGVALQDGELRHDVMQTHIGFSDHQVVSPGLTEDEARQALKCCVFRSLVAFLQREITNAKKHLLEQDTRRRVLSGRIRTTRDDIQRARMEEELRELAHDTAQGPRLKTLQDYFEFVLATLQKPEVYISCRNFEMTLTRMGIRISEAGMETDGGLRVPVTEITVASHQPRIAALARFPREELQPARDFVREADLFLTA